MVEEKEKKLLEKIEKGESADDIRRDEDAIVIYENGDVIGFVEKRDIDWNGDANYGGAWIGSERLLGWVNYGAGRIPICTDGAEIYGSCDNPSGFSENEEGANE